MPVNQSITKIPDECGDEVWRTTNLCHLYQVSNYGRVRSRAGKGPGDHDRGEWVIMRGSGGAGKHLRIRVKTGGVRRRFFVHRLVMVAFGPPKTFEGAIVLHDDGNPKNNRIDNLKWGTHAENSADRERHGKTAKGERSGVSTLTDVQVMEIVQMWACGMEQKDIARLYRSSTAAINHIVRRRCRRELTRGVITGC